MKKEYDFSKGIRGKFYRSNKVQKTIRLDQDIIVTNNPQEQTLLSVYQNYEKQCQISGLIDFADLLLKAYKMLKNNDNEENKKNMELLFAENKDIGVRENCELCSSILRLSEEKFLICSNIF